MKNSQIKSVENHEKTGGEGEEYKVGFKRPPKEYQFKPGHKVHRPKGSLSLLTILKRELRKIPLELKGKERKTYAEMLVKKQLHKAIIEGDEQSIKLIWNYVEGMPQQKIIGAGEEGEHIIRWQ